MPDNRPAERELRSLRSRPGSRPPGPRHAAPAGPTIASRPGLTQSARRGTAAPRSTRILRGSTQMAARRRNPDPAGRYAALQQLGSPTPLPATPEAAVLERVANPHPDKLYLARFTAPEFTSLCPITGQPDFAHLVLDYAPRQVARREQVAEAVPAGVPQPRRLPRGLHAGDRRPAGRVPRAALAACRGLLVSARRHAHRRLLADRRAAARTVAAGPGCGLVSRPRLMPRVPLRRGRSGARAGLL